MKFLQRGKYASLGIATISFMALIKFLISFITPFVILTIGRFLFCKMTDNTFAVYWPIHGAFFIAVICTLGSIATALSKNEKSCHEEVKAIPVSMICIVIWIFLIQFIWHGTACFFSDKEFLILDPCWIGDILLGVIVAVFCGIWRLMKQLMTRR